MSDFKARDPKLAALRPDLDKAEPVADAELIALIERAEGCSPKTNLLSELITMPVTHTVKCWPPYFGAIRRKEKNFDVRRDDRGYQKGDTLHLREFDPARFGSPFTGNDEHRKIKYILTGGQFGLEPGYVVLGF